ncbi:MAG: hypothetical protein H0Z31_09420 [Bacillus sp. (in: Bacteria)]|nr:hypothetical protein [Bacillus sp. (in: firmicutes)]
MFKSLLIFSKLFTRRQLPREQEAARPILERSEGSDLPAESVRHKRNV